MIIKLGIIYYNDMIHGPLQWYLYTYIILCRVRVCLCYAYSLPYPRNLVGQFSLGCPRQNVYYQLNKNATMAAADSTRIGFLLRRQTKLDARVGIST